MMWGVFRCSADTCITRKDLTPKDYRLAGLDPTKERKTGDAIGKVLDSRLASVWEDANPYNHTFSTIGLQPPIPFLGPVKKRAHCPFSRQRTTDRLCPICHKSLHSQFGEGTERRLTLIGATNAGKSNYIAVLVHELGERLGSRFGFGVQRMNQYTSTEYDTRYYAPVYTRRECVEGTKKVEARRYSVAPLVFGLKTKTQRGFSTISFFDPPGEGVINESNVERFHHFVFNSHGLVLLVDGENLIKGEQAGGAFNEATKVLGAAVNQLEAERSWTKRLRPYLAIALSKADLLAHLTDMPSQALVHPNYDRGFDFSDFRVVSSGLETLIRRRGGSNFCNIAQKAFGEDRVGFFAVSAFGSAPDEHTRKIPKLEPLRVVDPFLWLMSQTGILAAIERSSR